MAVVHVSHNICVRASRTHDTTSVVLGGNHFAIVSAISDQSRNLFGATTHDTHDTASAICLGEHGTIVVAAVEQVEWSATAVTYDTAGTVCARLHFTIVHIALNGIGFRNTADNTTCGIGVGHDFCAVHTVGHSASII